MGKRYLVIGSNCFTGSHIVKTLLDNPENLVFGFSRSPEYKELYLPYKNGDTSKFYFQQIDLARDFQKMMRLIDEIAPHVIVQVAALSEVALSNERPVEYFSTNTLGVVRLCDALRRRPYLQHYVHISSAEIFGSCQSPVDETAPFYPSTPYAVSKAAADMFLNTLMKNFQFPGIIIRSTNVYGPHQQLFKIIPRTVIYLKMGRILELHGGGGAVKSFVHIRDVVRGLMSAIDAGRPGAYHFSTTSRLTVAEVVNTVTRQMGYRFNEVTKAVGERLGQDSRYLLDCSKAKQVLGWEAQEDFEGGVAEVVTWIEQNWETIKNEPLEYQHKL